MKPVCEYAGPIGEYEFTSSPAEIPEPPFHAKNLLPHLRIVNQLVEEGQAEVLDQPRKVLLDPAL